MTKMHGQKEFSGAEEKLEQSVRNHLFIIGPNNCGSTFVARAVEQCAATWSLPREGQHMLGFTGPDTIEKGISLTWAHSPETIGLIQDPSHYDWSRTKQAWYFQARATRADADIFVTKSPPFLLIVDQLKQYFDGVQFIFLLRNPYAIIEGICRRTGSAEPGRTEALRAASKHVAACFDHQKRNIQTYGSSSVFLTYENICADPEAAREAVQELVPSLSDLRFDQKLSVKGMYDEMLRNMNDDQIERLSGSDLETINETLAPHLDLIDSLGYRLISPD